MAIAADCQINAYKDTRQVDTVGIGERSFQNGLGYFEADEVMIGAGRVVSFCDLIDVETKFNRRS